MTSPHGDEGKQSVLKFTVDSKEREFMLFTKDGKHVGDLILDEPAPKYVGKLRASLDHPFTEQPATPALEASRVSIKRNRDAAHPKAYDALLLDGIFVGWIVKAERSDEIEAALTATPLGKPAGTDAVCMCSHSKSKHWDENGHEGCDGERYGLCSCIHFEPATEAVDDSAHYDGTCDCQPLSELPELQELLATEPVCDQCGHREVIHSEYRCHFGAGEDKSEQCFCERFEPACRNCAHRERLHTKGECDLEYCDCGTFPESPDAL